MHTSGLEKFGVKSEVQWFELDEHETYCSELVLVKGASAKRLLDELRVEVGEVTRLAIYLDRADIHFLNSGYPAKPTYYRSAMYWLADQQLPVHITVDISLLAARVGNR